MSSFKTTVQEKFPKLYIHSPQPYLAAYTWKNKDCACALRCVWLFETPWTPAHQAPLSMGFSRREYWSGLLFPPKGVFLIPGSNPTSLDSPALVGGFFTTSATWESPRIKTRWQIYIIQLLFIPVRLYYFETNHWLSRQNSKLRNLEKCLK